MAPKCTPRAEPALSAVALRGGAKEQRSKGAEGESKIENRKSRIQVLLVVAVAIALTYLFWRPLWHGGGLIGGDTYSYYFPQKSFYADELHAGRIPLWNPLVGHGYPTVGESQTGVFYPPNLLLFSLLPVNTAYNAAQLLHYVLAFVVTWLFARRLGLGMCGALLCALVYVYGWFAPRICLEWAIIGGVYLPLLAWCAESYLQTRRARYLAIMSLSVGLHLLAGHFNLAFIEVLAVATYATMRAAFLPPLPREQPANLIDPHSGERHPEGTRVRGPEKVGGATGSASASINKTSNCAALAKPVARRLRSRLAAILPIALAIAAGFGLAAVQLAPTWELKQRSQRADVGDAHNPGYGHIPPVYLVQVVTPWMWYAPDVDADQALVSLSTLSYPAATNKVEAHLYFGLIPLALAVIGLGQRRWSGEELPAPLRIWLWIGLAGALYATGWLLPVTKHLPGFSFFIGPGRYGILTTLAVGLLAGDAFDRWLAHRAVRLKTLAIVAVLGLTVLDLWVVRIHWNRRVDGAPNWYADLIPDPPINHRDESEVRALLRKSGQPVRLWAPFANMPTILGVSMVPTYLGLSPAEYLNPKLTLPPLAGTSATPDEREARVAWLRQAGVTHILTDDPAEFSAGGWPVELVWSGYDAFLNRAWGRREAIFLYQLEDARGRIAHGPQSSATISDYDHDRVQIEVTAETPDDLVLMDLVYPGWSAQIDGKPATTFTAFQMFRAVHIEPGRHTIVWSYEPATIHIGAIISAATAALLSLGLWLARRRA